MIKANTGIELHKLSRLGFQKARDGVYSIKIPNTFRFDYYICIADGDIFIDVIGLMRGNESMDFEEGLKKLYFRNSDKREFVEEIIQLLINNDFVIDTEGKFQKKDEFQEMIERFSELLPSYKCRRDNHENCNDVFGKNLKTLFENAKNKGCIPIGICKEPEYAKPHSWGLVFEDTNTFEEYWYHCGDFCAEKLYDEARVLTGKETDPHMIEFFKRWGEL